MASHNGKVKRRWRAAVLKAIRRQFELPPILLLAACGHSDDATQAEDRRVQVVGQAAGPTSFVANLMLSLDDFAHHPGNYLVGYAAAAGRTRARLLGLNSDYRIAFDYEYPTSGCGTVFIAQPIGFTGLVLK